MSKYVQHNIQIIEISISCAYIVFFFPTKLWDLGPDHLCACHCNYSEFSKFKGNAMFDFLNGIVNPFQNKPIYLHVCVF